MNLFDALSKAPAGVKDQAMKLWDLLSGKTASRASDESWQQIMGTGKYAPPREPSSAAPTPPQKVTVYGGGTNPATPGTSLP